MTRIMNLIYAKFSRRDITENDVQLHRKATGLSPVELPVTTIKDFAECRNRVLLCAVGS